MIFLLFLFQNALTGVTVSGLFTADAPPKPTSVIEVGGTALTGVTANTVLSAARLQDGLPRDIFSIHKINKNSTHHRHTRFR